MMRFVHIDVGLPASAVTRCQSDMCCLVWHILVSIVIVECHHEYMDVDAWRRECGMHGGVR